MTTRRAISICSATKSLVALILLLLLPGSAMAQKTPGAGRTSFQIAGGWKANLDFQQDSVMVYGWSPDLPQRIASWREHGYRVEFMTGVAWGGYNDFQSGKWVS